MLPLMHENVLLEWFLAVFVDLTVASHTSVCVHPFW